MSNNQSSLKGCLGFFNIVAPILIITVLDKTKGDTITKGAERQFKGLAVKMTTKESVDDLKATIPGLLTANKIGLTSMNDTK